MNIDTLLNIGIVGSRTFEDYEYMKSILDRFFKFKRIISGGAKGADLLGRRYAQENSIEIKEFLPDWEKFGKKAGFIRNRDIVEHSDIIVAFWDGESKGTENTISLAKEAKKEVFIYWKK